MVFCGIPSRACAECRIRRTKCDFLIPSCSQCIRMGRNCNGYRDPVAALFRDESTGFAIKGQPLARPSHASRKSSQEIDKAFAACSGIFGTSSVGVSDHSRKDSVSFEPIPEWLQTRPSIEDQDMGFLHEKYTMDEPDAFNDNPRHMLIMSGCEQSKYVVVDNDTSLEIAGLANYCDVSDTSIDTHSKYNLAFTELCYIRGQNYDRIFAGDYLSEIANTCDNTSSTIDLQLLTFDEVTKQPISTGFDMDFDTMHRNSLLLPNITWSMESQAPCYFFANYVLEDRSCLKCYLEYLPDLCHNEVTNGFLTEAVTALGLVGLSRRRHDLSFLNSARKKYASALNHLNVALTSEAGALTDQALTAVFLLGLYEINTCSAPQNIRAWTKHIGGAIAMLQLRGKEQLDSHVGQHIFLQWRSQIITYCLHRRIRMPPFILEWSQAMMQHETPDEAMATSLCITTAKLCALRADMKYFCNYSKSGTAVPRAIAIDAEFAEWGGSCPAQHKPTTVTVTTTSDFAYEDYFLIYSSVIVAAIWGDYRRMRILCHEIILQHLPHLIEHQPEHPDLDFSMREMEFQLYESKESIERLAKETCASVPFHFGSHLGTDKCRTLAPKAVCGNLLLRPLHMAAEPKFVSDHLRKWVIGRFEKIAEVMGIKQATSLAHLVKIGVNLDEWENTF